jgi:thiol-disulfide isomerase/thioredoxin
VVQTTPAPATPTPAAPAAPSPPAGGIRNKIAAGDLLSAESILEAYRNRVSEDGPWLVGYSWLARGALLLGENEKARRYSDDVYARCAGRVAAGTDLARDDDVAYALGSVIEVEAQRRARDHGRQRAVEYVRGELAKWNGPVAFRSRLQKRINLMTLEGSPAPELAVEEFVGEQPPTLASLKGKPVVLFVWEKSCGDCRGQEPALAHVRKQFADRGVELVVLTRHFNTGEERSVESARMDSVWKSAFADVGPAPIVVSAASMERYGGSSTPTFVFVDRKGIVRRYTPTRLTEAELSRSVSALLD